LTTLVTQAYNPCHFKTTGLHPPFAALLENLLPYFPLHRWPGTAVSKQYYPSSSLDKISATYYLGALEIKTSLLSPRWHCFKSLSFFKPQQFLPLTTNMYFRWVYLLLSSFFLAPSSSRHFLGYLFIWVCSCDTRNLGNGSTSVCCWVLFFFVFFFPFCWVVSPKALLLGVVLLHCSSLCSSFLFAGSFFFTSVVGPKKALLLLSFVLRLGFGCCSSVLLAFAGSLSGGYLVAIFYFCRWQLLRVFCPFPVLLLHFFFLPSSPFYGYQSSGLLWWPVRRRCCWVWFFFLSFFFCCW
jgi:hypothetical protein